MKLFGFSILKDQNPGEPKKIVQELPEDTRDGSQEIGAGFYGYAISFENAPVEDETLLITKYRELAQQPEIERAVDDIVNEAFSYEDDVYPVEVNLDGIEDSALPKPVKEKIRAEFKYILDLLDFKNEAYEIFKGWYVDGRLFYQKGIDVNNPTDGIIELIRVDPRKIRKIREVIKQPGKPTPVNSDIANLEQLKKKHVEYYIYNPEGITKQNPKGVRITPDSIVYINSGLLDKTSRTVLSYLHKAIKPYNQLRELEDAMVIYRIARAPERRVFNLEVGRLPKGKAEQYVQEMMQRFRRKLQYDQTTGEIRDDRRYMTMLEDFWFPKVEGKGTTVEQLPGGQGLNNMGDVDYFKKKLYESLNIPSTRFDSSQANPFNSQATEISRDELKFMKFISRLRKRFSKLFDELLGTHLILKGIVTQDEWDIICKNLSYDYLEDNYFTEVKNQQIWAGRINTFNQALVLVQEGIASKAWIRRELLNIPDEEAEEMAADIEKEQKESQQKEIDKMKAQIDAGVVAPPGAPGQPPDQQQSPPNPFGAPQPPQA